MTARFGLPKLAFRMAACAGGLAVLPSAAAVIGAPDRFTVASWAVEMGQDVHSVERRYAATGVVRCEWDDPVYGRRTSIASGQVTATPDVLTLSGHTFIDPASCLPKATAASCGFTITVDGEVETAGLAAVLAVGIDCSPSSSQSLGDRLRNDWAVVRLDREMAVIPYALGSAGVTVDQGAAVLSVTHSHDYIVFTADGAQTHPKTIGACTVRDVDERRSVLVYFTTDCDGAQRSSGGSVVSAEPSGIPVLVGIWAASNEDRILLEAAVQRITEAGIYRDDLANQGEYRVNGWSSRHVPVAGAFLAAIRAATDTAH